MRNEQSEALAIWREFRPQILELIKQETQNCIRQKVVTVVTAPNGTTMGVMQPNDDTHTIFNVPYVSTLSNVPIGTRVRIDWSYGMSNAIAVSFSDGQGGSGGGGTSDYLWYPTVSPDGDLSFTLTSEADPPPVVNIMGPQGPQGPEGPAGPQGPQGPQGEQAKVVNDLTTGGADAALSAEQGKVLGAALSNKAEWDGGFLNSGSILTWAENQAINTHVATNSGVTGFLYATAWAVDFYLYPAGGWRRLIATDIQLGVSYYCVKNASQPWSTWTPIATATLPNGYNLPLTDGISVQAGLAAVYSKDQFGQVIVLGSLSGQMPNGAVVATLPSGFRPIYTFETPATCDFDTGRIQVNSLGEIRVKSKLSECSSFSFLAVFVAEK